MDKKDASFIDPKEADQFAPFLEEEIIDTNELSLVSTNNLKERTWNHGDASAHSSGRVLQDMMIVRSRLAFDEQEFRDRCQKGQAQFNARFKALVDKLYDSLDSIVADLSKSIYQIQMEYMQRFDASLGDVRRKILQAETIEQNMQTFLTQMRQACKVLEHISDIDDIKP